MRRSPGFTTVALLVLALGIGVNVAVFSLVNAVLFRPLPVKDADQVRFLYLTDVNQPQFFAPVYYRDFLDLAARDDLFEGLAGRSADQSQMRLDGRTEAARGERVTTNYFSLLGVAARLGRTLQPGDDEGFDTLPSIVLSHTLWTSRFASDENVIGRRVDLDRRTYVVVGLMGPEFRGLLSAWEPASYWVSFQQRAINRECPTNFNESGAAYPIARLKAGVNDAMAAQVLGAIRVPPPMIRGGSTPSAKLWPVRVFDANQAALPFDSRGQIVPSRLASALLVVTGLVLLIATANLAGLVMARGVARRGEIAVRLTLGATAFRVFRQLAAEGLAVAVAGGALGFLLARVAVATLLGFAPPSFTPFGAAANAANAISLDVPVDWRVLAFTIVVSLAASLLAALAPARQAAKTDLLSELGGQGAGSSRQGRSRLRHWIVVPQISLSLTLLFLSGTVVRTLLRSEVVDPGYAINDTVALNVALPRTYCDSLRKTEPAAYSRAGQAYSAAAGAFTAELLERIQQTPGVRSAALTYALPTSGSYRSWVMAQDGFLEGHQYRWIGNPAVTRDYFETMQIPLLAGRRFDDLDVQAAKQVTIVDTSLARYLWGDQNPLGRRIAFRAVDSTYPPVWYEVVGVVAEVRPPLSQGEANPMAYQPPRKAGMFGSDTTLVVAIDGNAGTTIADLERAVLAANPDAMIYQARPIADIVREVLYPRRLAATVLGGAGVAGMLLASLGLYGVLAYSVSQRLREIGIRAALGATRRDLIRLVMREGGFVLTVGLVLGVGMGYGAVRLTSRYVVALPALDTLTAIVVPLILAAVVLFASYLPARRAARVDPLVVLRTV